MNGREPKVSVVVATYNRADILEENAKTVVNQSYENFEVIYVDDSSTDQTESVLKSLVAQHPGRVRAIRVPNGGPGPARNAGVNESNGKFVLFTDDDTLVPNDWISRMVDAYQHCQHDALCGGFTPFSMDTDVERYLHYRMSILFGNRAKPIRAAPMMNFLLPRALFLKVGGFSSEYLPAAEDWEFCLRLRAQGYRIYYDPSISISHRYQTDWEGAGRRIQAAGEMGVRVCALRGKNVPVYTAYTCLRFIASPMWILRHYPMELYRKALKMEFAFCQARIAACMSHCRHS